VEKRAGLKAPASPSNPSDSKTVTARDSVAGLVVLFQWKVLVVRNSTAYVASELSDFPTHKALLVEKQARSTTVYLEPGESVEWALRRLKKAMDAAGILRDYRARQRFTPKSEQRRDKSLRARKRRSP
jgi:ribosomal protein S21